MPESHEKRQRNRRKQQRRKEKLERKLQRKTDKRIADAGGPAPQFHTFICDGETFRLATDLWWCVLDLAAVSGWTPAAPGDEEQAEEVGRAYVRPEGLTLTPAVATSLARSLENLLPTIPDQELPFSNSPFGEFHTEDLLTRRVAGEQLAPEDAYTAQELLSGEPKRDVARLATFLRAGEVTIEAG